jgi:hypothetical protein
MTVSAKVRSTQANVLSQFIIEWDRGELVIGSHPRTRCMARCKLSVRISFTNRRGRLLDRGTGRFEPNVARIAWPAFNPRIGQPPIFNVPLGAISGGAYALAAGTVAAGSSSGAEVIPITLVIEKLLEQAA